VTLAGLQLLEANHPHRVRLEYAANLACSIPCCGTNKVVSSTLVSTLKEHIPLTGEIGQAQDTPQNLFTENIILQGRNYVVFPGLVDEGVFTLQELLDTLSSAKDETVAGLRERVLPAIKALLVLTDASAKRLGYSRNQDEPDRWLPDIGYSSVADMAAAAAASWFSRDDIDSLLSPSGLSPSDLTSFTLKPNGLGSTAEDPLLNPMDACPLRISDGGLVLAVPGVVLAAARHYVWGEATRIGAVPGLATARQKVASSTAWRNLLWLGFDPTHIELPKWNTPAQVNEGVFRIDTDKLAHILVVADNGDDYNPANLYSSAWFPSFGDRLGQRHAQVTDFLTSDGSQDCAAVFALTVLCSIGRTTGVGHNLEHSRARSLLVSSAELNVLAGLRSKCDSLVLWKFAGAAQDGPSMSTSTMLDAFALYRRHRDSFYTSDDFRPTDIMIEPGYGRNMRISVVKTWDIHLAPWGEPAVGIRVCRAADDEHVPIYTPMPRQIPDSVLTRLVLGYSQAVWVSARPADAEDMDQVHRVLCDVVGMMAHWLMVLRCQLSSHLDALGPYPVELEMRLAQAAAWASDMRQPKPVDEMELNFPIEVARSKVSITIPIEVQDIACRPDNSADRVLALAMLAGLGALIEALNGENRLCEDERQRIVDACLPLGAGKSFIVFSGARDTGLYGFDKPRLRLVQESDVQAVADEVATKAGEGIPSTLEVLPREDSERLCEKAVEVATDAMRHLALKMDGRLLLKGLIGNYEAILQERAVLKVTRPTRTALAVDPSAELRKLRDEVEQLDRAALATRTLIEFVAAEPPGGDGRPSLEDLDRLLAYGTHIVYWGFVSEGVHLKLFDTGLRVLASGRIGRQDDAAYQRYATDYVAAKTVERVQLDATRFAKWFQPISQGSAPEAPPGLEKAFRAEFALAPAEFRKLVEALMQTSAYNNQSVMCQERATLTHLLCESTRIARSQVDAFLERFSLRVRDRWDSSPEGFQKHDWYPWRYNRQLAYESRFLVITASPGADETVHWGIRHLGTAADHLAHLISIGRFDGRSREMIALEGRLRHRLGDDFTNQVAKWFTGSLGWRAESNVPLRPKKALAPLTDLGDIDVLTWDPKSGVLFSLECKDVVTSRSPREMQHELRYFLDSASSKGSYVAKHSKRHEWLVRNLGVVSSWMKLPFGPVAVVSAFVTSEEVPTAYLRAVPLKVVSLGALKKNGVQVLLDGEPGT
jgi:hypothetical protein